MKCTLTDEELIHQWLSGQSNQCFEIFYNRYADKVYRRCLFMTKDTIQSQDLTHDIFLRVFDKLHTFQKRSYFSTWLYSITSNYCLDYLKQTNQLNKVVFDEHQMWQLPDSGETVCYEEVMQLRERALENLSSNEQTFLRLKYEQGISMKELAVMYALKEGVVKMRLKRTRDKVQRFYVLQQAD